MSKSASIDIAHKGMLYVRYDKTNRQGFLNRLVEWGYTIRPYLWDEADYTFPIITVDPVNKLAFAAGVTVMACYCSQGGKEVDQAFALKIIEHHQGNNKKTSS
jgi:hypothetical protein